MTDVVTVDVITYFTEYKMSLSPVRPLKTCYKPRRIGLSRRFSKSK